MKKFLLLFVLSTFVGVPAFAGSINVLGGFVSPSGDSDVFEQNEVETTFEQSDLNGFGATLGYDHFLGEFVNIGGSVSFYSSDTTVQDVDFEFSDGSPILRDISFQVVPLELNVRFLPVGRESAIIPYVGGGAGIYVWEYEELGDFVIDRNTDPTVITGTAFSDGADPGFHIEGGVYVPVSSGIAVAAEAKWWKAEGDLDPEGFDPRFEPLDLSGFMISGGISFWF